MASVESLAQCLQSTLVPDPATRKAAERALEDMQIQQGFASVPLALVQAPQADRASRQAAALLFKNFVRKHWAPEEEATREWSEPERTALKDQVVPVMMALASEPALQVQIGEAIAIMAESDFPDQWPGLVDQLVSSMSQDNFIINNAVLSTAHAIFKRWRSKFRTDSLFLEIKFVLDRFCGPYLAVFQRVDQLLSSPQALPSPSDPKTLAKSLLLCLQLFFDLNCQDIPEFFEDNQEPFMQLLHKYLTWSRPELVTEAPANDEEDDDEAEASELEKIRASICEIVELYSQRYQDVFPQMDMFVETVWTMVTSLGTSRRFDILVSKAVKFLSVVVRMPGKQALFSSPQTLESFCERIILPNMVLRNFEQELFEDDPLEYLRRDIEVTDADTRRQAAADFTQALMQQYEQQVTEIITRYVGAYLQQYASNPAANWKSKDTALFLLTSVASRSSSQVHGVTSTNALVDVVRFFQEHILPDLQPGAANNVHPVIQADAIKYIHTFRSQLSKDQLLAVLPLLVPFLENPSFVIHTYAAITIERVLFIKRDNKLLFTQTDIRPFAESILVALLKNVERGATPEQIAANDHLMKCVMRVIITARQALIPSYSTVLSHLVAILTEVSKNPSNPRFNHFAFESVSALIRFVVSGNRATLAEFEQALFPPFTYILQQDVQEFSPFVFQILSQLLELHEDGDMPDSYQGLIAPILTPALWAQSGNVPALVRLLKAIMAKGPDVLAANSQVGQVKDILRFLNSAGRKHDLAATDLAQGMFQYLPVQSLMSVINDIFIILLNKLMAKRSDTWTQGFIRALFFTIALNRPGFGADEIIGVLEGMQAGVFGQVLTALMPEFQKAPPKNRRIIALGLVILLTQSQRMQSPPLVQQWPVAMESLLRLFLLPQDLTAKGEDDEEVVVADPDDLSYQAAFSKLGASEAPRSDPLAQLGDPSEFLSRQLKAVSQASPGKFGPLLQAVPQEFRDPLLSSLGGSIA